jgi:hypothetical protein
LNRPLPILRIGVDVGVGVGVCVGIHRDGYIFVQVVQQQFLLLGTMEFHLDISAF